MAMIMPMATDEELALGQRISRNLQALLRARGLNQGQLAYKSGLSTSNVSNLVNGRKNPSFYSVAKAAIALDVDPLELAGFKPLHLPEVSDDDTSPDRLASRMSALEHDLLQLAKGQREVLKMLGAQDAKLPSRKRPKSA